MRTLFLDLKFALRQLRKSPGFTLTAVFMLAFGIGATTAIFSIVEGVLLRPLPYTNAERLFYIGKSVEKPTYDATSWLSYRDIRDQARTLETVAGYSNDAPAIFNGDTGAIRTRPHKTASGQVNLFDDPVKAQSAFSGPVGFTIGPRNILRGPKYFNQNLGLAKTFPLVSDKVNLKFRADAFNAFNHPNFALPSRGVAPSTNFDITGGTFGRLTAIDSGNVNPLNASNGNGYRVMQFALRLEF